MSKRTRFVTPGQRFGRGVVIDPEIRVANEPGARLLCDCGEEYAARLGCLLAGNTRSCGCLGRESRYGRKGHRKVFVTAGQRFGRGVVIDPETEYHNGQGKRVRAALMACDCGQEYTAGISQLSRGVAKSCGCLHREGPGRIHGLWAHPLYRVWNGMMRRCYNPEHKAFHSYAGRGIVVCDRWHDAAVFVADIERLIGPRPEGRSAAGRMLWTLDRIDNDGNYEPGNVRWASARTQSHNSRSTKLTEEIVIDCRMRYAWGEASARELAAEYGVAIRTMYNALSGDRW